MFNAVPQRQSVDISAREEILVALLNAPKTGITIASLQTQTGVPRTTVQDVLGTLHREHIVAIVGDERTRGRPRSLYALTELGEKQLPSLSPMFAAEFYHTTEKMLGPLGMNMLLDQMAENAIAQLPSALPPAEVVKALNSFGYQADLLDDNEIIVNYCVFRSISRDTESICRFDRKVLTHLTGGQIEQVCCMATGDGTCRFKVHYDAQAAQ